MARGRNTKLDDDECRSAVNAVLTHGSVSAAAKALGMDRGTFQNRMRRAEALGLLKPGDRPSVPSRWRPGAEIVAARKAEFERVKASRPEQGTIAYLADDKPFMLVALGDPHLDNPGTDLALFERWTSVLDAGKHRHGFGLGDWLDNWVRPLSFLYATAETTAPEGWILLKHYLDQIGPHLIGSVAGNHDDWSGHSDVLGMLMHQLGVAHRSKSLRLILKTPGGHEVSIHARHRWSGKSMWNEAHGLKRAARFGGARENILLGGDLHISGETGPERDPMTGAITFGFQVASFKLIDDYADDKGLVDRHVSPAVALVIDPALPVTSPERVKHFYEPEPAVAYLAMLRKRK